MALIGILPETPPPLVGRGWGEGDVKFNIWRSYNIFNYPTNLSPLMKKENWVPESLLIDNWQLEHIPDILQPSREAENARII